MSHCRTCGRNTKRTRGICYKCKPKKPAAKVIHPTDADTEEIMNGLIRQRASEIKPPNYCYTDEPGEEKAIRARLEGRNAADTFADDGTI